MKINNKATYTKQHQSIVAWKVAEKTNSNNDNIKYYVTADGDCLIKIDNDILMSGSVSVRSFAGMAEALYSNFDWRREGKEKIKEGFVKILSGKSI